MAPPEPTPGTTSPQPPKKCHYTIHAYSCGHSTFASSNTTSTLNYLSSSTSNSESQGQQRVTHHYPCPFSIPCFGKSGNEGKIRCANMEREVWSREVGGNCGDCEGGKLGDGMREGQEAKIKGKVNREVRGGRGGILEMEKNPRMKPDGVVKEEWKRGKIGGFEDRGVDEGINDKRVDNTVGSLPFARNGNVDSQGNGTGFSIFRRVLGAVILGSGSKVEVERVGSVERSEKGEKGGEGMSAEGGKMDGKGEGKSTGKTKKKQKQKQKWIHIDEDPDWEVVDSEERM